METASITGSTDIHLHFSILSNWMDYMDEMKTCVFHFMKKPIKSQPDYCKFHYLVQYWHCFSSEKVSIVYNIMKTLTKIPNANSIMNQVKPQSGIYYLLHIFPNL